MKKAWIITTLLSSAFLAIAGWEIKETTTYAKEDGVFVTNKFIKIFNRWELSPYKTERIDKSEYLLSKFRAGNSIGSQLGEHEVLEVRNGKVINNEHGDRNSHTHVVDNAVTNPPIDTD